MSYLLKHKNDDSPKLSDFLVLDERRSYEDLAASSQEYIDKLMQYYKVRFGGSFKSIETAG